MTAKLPFGADICAVRDGERAAFVARTPKHLEPAYNWRKLTTAFNANTARPAKIDTMIRTIR